MKPILKISVVALSSTLLLAGCSQQETAASANSDGYYPVTVKNCGAEVTVESEPQQLVLLKPASAAALQALGVLDRSVARAGAFEEEYFDSATQVVLNDIPQLAGDLDASGHLQISADVVIDQQPDLLLGEVDNLPRQQLEQLDIPLIEEPALCQTGSTADPTWDSVYDQLRMYGEIFDRQDVAEDTVEALQQRVDKATEQVPQNEARTAAVLYPTVGGGTSYAYGTGSMSHPQLESAGFTNVFEDVTERVFEVTPEEIIGRDPDVLILLYSEGDPADVEQTIIDMPGAEQMTAVQNDDVMTQLMNFTEPATPLSVDGLERIIERFHE